MNLSSERARKVIFAVWDLFSLVTAHYPTNSPVARAAEKAVLAAWKGGAPPGDAPSRFRYDAPERPPGVMPRRLHELAGETFRGIVDEMPRCVPSLGHLRFAIGTFRRMLDDAAAKEFGSSEDLYWGNSRFFDEPTRVTLRAANRLARGLQDGTASAISA